MMKTETNTIHVLFCANPEYFQHLAVAGISLAQSNPTSRLEVHVITCDRDPEGERRLRDTFVTQPNVNLHLYFAGAELIGDFFVDGFMSRECYLRLIAPEILPEEVERFVYLDCDVVVVDDIRPLWEVELGDCVLAAAPDYPRLIEFMSPRHRDGLGIPRDAIYVNSGVLVVDAVTWRTEGLARRFVDYIREKGPLLTFYDQDAINAVLAGRIRLVDPRWNIQARMFYIGRASMPDDHAATTEARRHPAIIHFTGSEKPWLFRSRIAKKGVYFRNLDRTAWRGETPRVSTPLQEAEHRAGAFLARRFAVDYLQVLFKTRRLAQKSNEALFGLLGRPGDGAAGQ